MNQILLYFRAEKTESIIGLTLGVILILVAIFLFSGGATRRGVALVFLVFAVILFAVYGTVLLRTPKDISRVQNYLTENQAGISSVEIPRMQTVISNFKIYRWAEFALIFAGLLFMFFTENLWRGVGTGLVVCAMALLILDLIADQRARVYLEWLNQLYK